MSSSLKLAPTRTPSATAPQPVWLAQFLDGAGSKLRKATPVVAVFIDMGTRLGRKALAPGQAHTHPSRMVPAPIGVAVAAALLLFIHSMPLAHLPGANGLTCHGSRGQ